MGWKISPQHLETGLSNVIKNTGLRGRWEIINNNPTTIAETAHNREGLLIVLKQLLADNKEENIHFVLGFVKDKNIDSILSLFPKKSAYYFCQAKVPRAMDVYNLRNSARKYGLKGESHHSVESAIRAAKGAATKNETIYIGGSTFVVAEAL